MEVNHLRTYSYSKLDLFEQCKHKYKIKYIDGNYSNSSTIVLDLGTITHKGEELKGRYLINNETPDYSFIKDVVLNGIEEETAKDKNFIKGVNEIKRKYFLDFYTKNPKSGMNYEEKLQIYFNNLENKTMDKDWRVLAVEQPFEFVYDNRCVLKGFIDRIDINLNGDLRVVDYKSSNTTYDNKKLTTPLQMVIYTLACQEIYNKTPIEHKYDFIFLGQEQLACTKGYLNRGIKKLNKILDEIDRCNLEQEYIPSPTPLCYWCDFASHTPLANKNMCHLCQYHCLWTPTDKNFKKKNEYGSKKETEKINTNNPFVNPFTSSKPKDNVTNNPFGTFKF